MPISLTVRRTVLSFENRRLVTSVIIGPRTMEQFDDNSAALDVAITEDDETFIDSLVPPGEHAGQGCQDPAFPITGRG